VLPTAEHYVTALRIRYGQQPRIIVRTRVEQLKEVKIMLATENLAVPPAEQITTKRGSSNFPKWDMFFSS